MSEYLLTSVILHGVISSAIMQGISRRSLVIQKILAIVFAFVGLLFAMYIWSRFEPSMAFQFVENVDWIPSIGARYHLGIDGISLNLVVLTFWIVLVSVLTACTESSGIASACSLIFFTQAMAVGAFFVLWIHCYFIYFGNQVFCQCICSSGFLAQQRVDTLL